MTSTQDPATWTTPKTDRRVRRAVTLPAIWTANDDGTETVNRIVSDDGLSAHYAPSYKVAAGWGRIAVEQEIEAVDASMRRRWTIANAAAAAILLIPGYTED